MKQIIIVAAALIIATGLMLTVLAARAVAADDKPLTAAESDCIAKFGDSGDEREAEIGACMRQARADTAPRFKPWQRIWQCNDIRVTETVLQPGIVNYDLAGTIWGGSQFTLNVARGDLYFNGRPCLPLQR